MPENRKQQQDKSRPHRWKPLEPEFKTIVDRFTGQPYSLEEFQDAMEVVVPAIAQTATILAQYRRLRNAADLACIAEQRWWIAMLKPRGGFARYDGVRPFHRFAYSTLARMCFGQEMCDGDCRQVIVGAEPADDGQNLACDATRKATVKTVRRHVSLDFDPHDDRQKPVHDASREETAARVRQALDNLPSKQREVLTQVYWEDANLSALARERGERETALHMRAFHAREAVLRRLAGLKWRKLSSERIRQGKPIEE